MKKTFFTLGFIALLSSNIEKSFADGGMMGGGMMGGFSSIPFGSLGFGMGGGLFMILIWAIIIGAIIFFIKWIVQENNGQESEEKALDILKKRLAKGEISKKEYQKLKKEIIEL